MTSFWPYPQCQKKGTVWTILKININSILIKSMNNVVLDKILFCYSIALPQRPEEMNCEEKNSIIECEKHHSSLRISKDLPIMVPWSMLEGGGKVESSRCSFRNK